MKFDFENDLKEEIRKIFDIFSINHRNKLEFRSLLLDYLTLVKKLVRPTPRQVLYNPDLFDNLTTHPKRHEIRHLENLLKKGSNVNFYQSKRILQTDFHDHLAYEWNIYHFHLSLDKEPKSKFRKQTKQLLFVYITDSQVFLLGTDNHSDGIFGDTKWIEILHDHFPETIAQYKDPTITKVYPELNAIERQQLWNKGYLLGMTEVRGVVYHSPGIGRATSGHSVLVTKQLNEISRWLYDIDLEFKNHYDKICRFLGVDAELAHFKLTSGAETFEIIESSTKKYILKCYERLNLSLLEGL